MVFTGLLLTPGSALMWAQSRARQGEPASEMHISPLSLFSPKFCHIKIYDRIYLYISLLKVEML